MRDIDVMTSFWGAASICPSLYEIWSLMYGGFTLANTGEEFVRWCDAGRYHYWQRYWT